MASQSSEKLKITEIFFSLQGETNTVGIPTVFVRLTGCPLRCQYCDTGYAFSGGSSLSFDDIQKQISEFDTQYITVTGGEPLAQKSCVTLMSMLCDNGYTVSLETSGAMDISVVDERVVIVLDLKTPASGEESRNIYANIEQIKETDQIKFVICDRQDYEWAMEKMEQYDLNHRCHVLFSPSYAQQNATQLAQWILDDGLNVRFQMQLHKLLWGDAPGR